MLARRLAATVLLVLALAAGIGVVPAHAADSPPAAVTAQIKPETTGYIPRSLLAVRNLNGGVTNSFAPALAAASGAASTLQSVLNKGWNILTGRIARIGNGAGYSTEARCLMRFTASWPGGNAVTVQYNGVQANPGDTIYTADYCDGQNARLDVHCRLADGSMRFAGQTPPIDKNPRTYSSATLCSQVANSTLAALTYGATQESNLRSATDGGVIVNPAFQSATDASLAITVKKTCRPASGPDVTVQATGPAGSTAMPGVACPAGTSLVSMVSWASVMGLGSDLFAASISDSDRAAFADCLGPGKSCGLAVVLDGLKCAVSIQACADWWNKSQSNPAAVGCKWGNYDRPASDCEVLRNCYQYPLASISGASSGSACGVDPEAEEVAPPKPIQDGKIMEAREVYPSPSPTAPGTSAPGSNPTIIVNVPTPQVSVTVNVPQPTVVVNVPQPTVIVNVPNQGPVQVPAGKTGSECWPTGTAAYNPLDWVYTPLHCGLSALFIPSQGSIDALLGTPWNPLRKWTDNVALYAGAFAVAGGGCQGPPVALRFNLGPAGQFNKVIYPVNACNEPAASIARVSRVGSMAGLIFGAAFFSVSAIFAGIGLPLRMGGFLPTTKDKDGK